MLRLFWVLINKCNYYPWDECRNLESTIGYQAGENINNNFHHPSPRLDCLITIVQHIRINLGENDLYPANYTFSLEKVSSEISGSPIPHFLVY